MVVGEPDGQSGVVRAIAALRHERMHLLGSRSRTARLPEVDIARAVALLMMLLYHLLFSIWYFGMAEIEVLTGFWRIFAYTTAALFVMIAGLSLTLSEAAQRGRGRSGKECATTIARRGLLLIGWGLVITVVTLIVFPGSPILFGILHLIGTGTILAIPFLRHPRVAFVAGTVAVLLGPLANAIPGPLWLIWLGPHPADFATLDYVPLLPWFGVLLIGVAFGGLLFPGGERRWHLPVLPAWTSPLAWIGRHTLALYLVHEPIIVAVLLLIQRFA
jgi:uncharacterized membrane protein